MMIDNISVGKTIAKLRQNRNMTQQQLAAALNVSHQAVSKWENGAAMPDVQTLLDLTRLFGVTVEQLINGDIPEDRVPPKSPLEEPLRDIGNFINSIFKPVEKKDKPDEKPDEVEEEEDDGADDPEIEVEIHVTQDDAPADDPEETVETPNEEASAFDLQNLFKMAPFMSKSAVDALLLEHRDELTAADIAKFAPFISRECLEKLIQKPETEITWDTLQRVAPFLKREMVDKLTKAVANGSKAVRNAAGESNDSTDDLGKALGDMSQKIGSEMEKAVRKAVKLGSDAMNEAGKAINDLVDSVKGRESRVEALRKAAFERALQDEKWDWIAAHIEELKDEALKREIARKANGMGLHDWVLEHMNGYADTRTIDAAIEAGNWGWLGDHVWQFEDSLQERIALAAAQAENWQWLATYVEQISLEECADQVSILAYRAGEKVLAAQMAQRCMNKAQREALANAAVADGDYEFIERVADCLDESYFGSLCLASAQEGNWERVKTFIARADADSVARMMELAIAEGNFEAVDMLDPYL